jgi:hypothetical protein
MNKLTKVSAYVVIMFFIHYKDNQLDSEAAAAKLKLVSVKNDISPAVWKALQIDETPPTNLSA